MMINPVLRLLMKRLWETRILKMRPAAAKGLQVAGGSSKTRDASKHESATSGIGKNLLLGNKNEGYDDALGKKS